MKFKAQATIIIWHEDQMRIFNPGDKGDLPEDVIGQYIDGKQAVELKGKAAKADPEPEPEVEAAPEAPAAPADAIEAAPIA